MENAILFLFSKVEKLFANFLFPSRNWRKEFQSSLSLLQIGENNFKFLFLFSIGLFGLSSMTALLDPLGTLLDLLRTLLDPFGTKLDLFRTLLDPFGNVLDLLGTLIVPLWDPTGPV